MSEQQGLWYEISLSNRQVLAAFLILLVCIVGAFLSGVWVGREAVAGEAPLLVAEAGESDSEDSFQFFGEKGEEAQGAGDGAEPVARAATPSAAQQTPTSPVIVRRPEQERAAAESVRDVPEPAQSEREEAAPQLSADDLIIQVFSSADQEQARSVLKRLRAGGFQAFLSPVAVDGRTMYRVRVGPFASRPLAEKAATRVKREQRLDTWITSAAN